MYSKYFFQSPYLKSAILEPQEAAQVGAEVEDTQAEKTGACRVSFESLIVTMA